MRLILLWLLGVPVSVLFIALAAAHHLIARDTTISRHARRSTRFV
jgi:hypothetical protein